MAKEIERKFLVVSDVYKEMSVAQIQIAQGYLSRLPEATVRIRLADNSAFMTVKGVTERCTRAEFEYEIPMADAREMLAMCSGNIVEKTRWIVPFDGHKWEVDEFHGNREGLTVAEIELKCENEHFRLPPFVGKEVTGIPDYYNSNL